MGKDKEGEMEMRKECLERLTEIQNGLYMTDDVEVLKTAMGKITDLNDYLRRNIPYIAGLPTGRKRKPWQRRTLNKFQSKKRRKVSEKINVIKPVLKQSVARRKVEEKQQTVNTVKAASDALQQGNTEEALTLLWTAPNSDEPIGIVGPYSLSCSSFEYLKTTLSDEVIDAYLHLLSQQYRQCLHVSCVVMTAIFSGQANIHSLLRRENIFQYEYCVGAVNEGGHHWILMIIRPKDRQIIYLNPLGEVDNLKQQVLQHWYAFLQGRWEMEIDNDLPDKWALHCPTHSRQIDGLSCGVYVLKFAENYLKKSTLKMHWTKQDICKERRRIGVHLLSNITMFGGNDMDRILIEDVQESITEQVDSESPEVYTENVEMTEVQPEIVEITEVQPEIVEKVLNRVQPENAEEECIEEFEPTPWFQPVKKGHKIPRGLHCVLNIETGETQAKLIEDTKEYKIWEEKQKKGYVEKPVQPEKPVESDESDGDPDEDTFFIDRKTANKNIDVAFSRVDSIIKLKEKKKFWMRRHYTFRQFQKVVGKGYGFAIFSTQAIMLVKEKVEKRFFTDSTGTLFGRHGRIIGMEDEDLNKLFLEDRFLARNYCLEVLATEALAAIVQHCAGITYKKADAECQVTEGYRNETQAGMAGFILSSEKKEALSGKGKK